MPSEIRGSDNFDSDSVGKVLQIVNFQTGAVATGTTLIPLDDTIPQNTEGTEFMTLAITPTSATSKLRIDVVANFRVTGAPVVATALFQDTTANALGVCFVHDSATANDMFNPSFVHTMTSGTTSTTTFKVRIGPHASSTVTFNGSNGSRYYGGTLSSSITITEYEV